MEPSWVPDSVHVMSAVLSAASFMFSVLILHCSIQSLLSLNCFGTASKNEITLCTKVLVSAHFCVRNYLAIYLAVV